MNTNDKKYLGIIYVKIKKYIKCFYLKVNKSACERSDYCLAFEDADN